MILRLVVLYFLVYAIYQIPSQFLQNDFFKIQKINIAETSEVMNQELTAFAEDLYGKKLCQLDLPAMEAKLAKDVRLDAAEIRNPAKGELNIRVQEKDFQYYTQVQERIYLMDKSGKIIGYYQEREKRSLPMLVAETETEQKNILEILKILENYSFYDSISQIVQKNDHCTEIILVDGSRLLTNPQVDKEKYKLATALYSSLGQERQIEYIDIRFQDFVIRYAEDDYGR